MGAEVLYGMWASIPVRFGIADSSSVALDVLGKDALQIWGHQFVKVLRLIYDGATTGLGDGGDGKLLGGSTPDGIAARARVKLEVEAIMKG